MRKTVVSLCLILAVFATSAIRAQNKTKELTEKEQLTAAQYGMVLTTLDGKTTTTLGQLAKNKVVVLNFWAYWCPPCVKEMPSFQKLYDQFKDNPNIVFIFAACDNYETSKEVKDFLKEQKLELPVYMVKATDVTSLFTIYSIPTTFILDKTSTIILYNKGGRDWADPEIVTLLNKLIN